MNRTRAAALAAMTLAIALPAAACVGGDDADEFRADYNAAVENLSKVNDDIGQAGGAAGESNQQIAKKFDEIADTAEQTRTDLAALEPPEDAKEEFDELLAAPEGRCRPARGGRRRDLERSGRHHAGRVGPVRERRGDHKGRGRPQRRRRPGKYRGHRGLTPPGPR